MSKQKPIYHKIYLDAHPELNLTEIPNSYVIHHIDENRDNNDISNLQMMTKSEHDSYHMLKKYKSGIINNSGENNPMFGKKHSEESKLKMSINSDNSNKNNPMFGKKYTDEEKLKLSESHKGKHIGELNGMFGKKRTEESKKMQSDKMKGRIPWNKGLKK